MSDFLGHFEDSTGNSLLATPHSMANIEDGTTASQIYTVGNMLVFNNRLCKVTSAIAQGDTLEIGTNIAYKNISDIGNQLVSSDGKEFYFDVKDGEYGYYPSASKVAEEFVPFGGTASNFDFLDWAIIAISEAGLSIGRNGSTKNPSKIYYKTEYNENVFAYGPQQWIFLTAGEGVVDISSFSASITSLKFSGFSSGNISKFIIK